MGRRKLPPNQRRIPRTVHVPPELDAAVEALAKSSAVPYSRVLMKWARIGMKWATRKGGQHE
jgi:hypothetical protein